MTKIYLIMGLLLFSLGAKSTSDFNELATLFTQWRAFEVAPLYNSAPDYRQGTFAKRQAQWADFKSRLLALDKSAWTVPQQIDWFVVLAELNGYDFNHRVLKPWVRDPAFTNKFRLTKAMYQHTKAQHRTISLSYGLMSFR